MELEQPQDGGGDLTGQLLVAMPGMTDARFTHAVIYLCAHGDEGAMGLAVNQPLEDVTFRELLRQHEISCETGLADAGCVYAGGPVEPGRGFVLHSPDYRIEETLLIANRIGLTASPQILRDIAAGHGPRQSLVALGYAGWAPGQLEAELRHNVWLTCPASLELLLTGDARTKWEQALASVGATPAFLSLQGGNA